MASIYANLLEQQQQQQRTKQNKQKKSLRKELYMSGVFDFDCTTSLSISSSECRFFFFYHDLHTVNNTKKARKANKSS